MAEGCQYHYVDCGLPNVWLDGGVTTVDTGYGPSTAIEDLGELHHQISMDIINSPGRMTGAEFRFLRIELDMSQRALSMVLNTSGKNIQRWESHKEKRVPGPVSFSIGALYAASKSDEKLRELVDRVSSLDRQVTEHENREFVHSGDHWTSAA